ncbi:MAG: T9SS type A sorting domain-containing protein [Bacteroidetes bacterium]|nr:T9SS type A sorting domain-containing protein [Bacteroidota bacterium]MCL2301891.1 T9SS type A sorting domain-containing protein [Lentimicrobiaceae bacterium]
MNYRIFLLSVFLFINHLGAISQSKIVSEDVLALTQIETPSFVIHFEYNEYGYVISETKVVPSNDYLSYKFEYEYDESDNLTLLKKYSKNLSVWNFSYYEENEYNDNNQIIVKKTYEDYGAGFRPVEQLFYTYQDTFLETILVQLISSGGQEFNNIKQDFFYDKEHQLFQIKQHAWIVGSSSWLHSETFEFEYDDFGNLLTYSNEKLHGEDFMKDWRYVFTYNDSQELTERAYYLGYYEWNSIPVDKYLYHLEVTKESETILFPNVYQFDRLNFNWFQPNEKLVRDEYWISDCGGDIRFVESANYSYTPFSFGVEVKNYEKDEILIYPNPTTGELRIKNCGLQIENVEIFDVYGKNVGAKNLLSLQNTINIFHLPAGIYFVRLTSGNQIIHTEKLIKL